MPKVAVVGAGVIGLSSALHVLETCPSAEVILFADRFPPDTTTNVSAGFWLPHLLGNTPTHLIRKWGGKTLRHMVALARSDSAKYTGACIISGYELSASAVLETPIWSDMVKNFHHLNEEELSVFPGMRSGFFFTSAIIEPGPYLEFLMKRIQRKGAKLRKRLITSLNELAAEGFDVIVNCTGLGSRRLVQDQHLQPIRGQVIRISAPWIKQFYTFEESSEKVCHIVPGMSYVTVGGIENVGDENTEVNPEDKTNIWKRCIKHCPSLTEAKIQSDHVGLRPARPSSVRLEQEVIYCNGKPQVVVHNYGHGGGGVTLHWGCAEDTAALVKNAIDSQSSKSKL